MYFIYNGISSKDFGIKIKKNGINNFSSPQRSYENILVPGRNGELFIDNGNYENFILNIDCCLDARRHNLNEVSRNIKSWLQSDLKYKKLILSTDDEVYYEAICNNKLDISQVFRNFGESIISFSCKPFKKVIYGENKIVLTSQKNIINNYMTSNPHIKVVGNGDITININNQNLILKGVEDEIEVDSDIMNCYKTVDSIITNQNNKMYSEFPVIEEGRNNISWTGNVTRLEIIPRWAVL